MSIDQTRGAFRVYGRVQGVGFRWWTRQTARGLGLSGRVRNLPDGSVEVHAAGSPEAVRELEQRLAEGPRAAAVRRVDPIPPRDIPGGEFRIEM